MGVTLITNLYHLNSEEMHIFGQDIDISDIIGLSSPELHVPFYIDEGLSESLTWESRCATVKYASCPYDV